jgi:hypothetical protein
MHRPRTRPAQIPAPVLVALLVSAMAPVRADAQSPSLSSRATAMGDVAYDALACGPDALSANPAALARPCPSPVRVLVLPTLRIEAADNGAGGEIWRHRSALLDAIDQETFVDAVDPAARDAILGRIPAEGYVHRVRVHLPIAQASVGPSTAFSLTFSAEDSGRLTRDLVELALLGYEEGRTAYVLGGTEHALTGYWTLAFGHGRDYRGTDVGITARLISGTFRTHWEASDPQVSLPEQRVTGTMVGAFAGDNLMSGNLFGFRTPDGIGLTIDIGAMRDVGPVRIGLALQNALGGMRWTRDIHMQILTVDGTLDGTEFESREELYDPATAGPAERSAAEALRRDARFPRRLRASAAWSPTPVVSLGAGAEVLVGSGQLDRDWDRRVSLGGEVRPLTFLRFHGGLAADLDGASAWSGGLELDVFRTRLGIGAARLSEPGREAGWDRMSGWRIVAGLSRF